MPSSDGSHSTRAEQNRSDPPRTATDRDEHGYEQRLSTQPAKTSAAAAFALALGVAAFVLAITILLAPIGLVLGILGLILGIIGIRAAKKTGITGKGVAITGLVFSVLAVLIAGTLAIGITTFLNNEGAVNRLEQQIQQLKDKLPDQVDVPTP